MNAGLPTTGIGGIFYFISVFVMLFAEILISAQGKSSLARWKFVAGQVLLVLGIITASWGTAHILVKVVPQQLRTSLLAVAGTPITSQNIQIFFLTPFIILGALLITTQVLRAFFVLKMKLR